MFKEQSIKKQIFFNHDMVRFYLPNNALIQVSVSESIKHDKHCVVMSTRVLAALQDIHQCRASFKPTDDGS